MAFLSIIGPLLIVGLLPSIEACTLNAKSSQERVPSGSASSAKPGEAERAADGPSTHANRGGLTALEGPPSARAIDVCPSVAAQDRGAAIEEMSEDQRGGIVPRTIISLVVTRDASVKDVNEVLGSIRGRIVSAVQGTGAFSVRIPDPGSLEKLDEIIGRVRRQSPSTVLLDVAREEMPQPVADDLRAQLRERRRNP
jgi:hypothetical protein